jgi:hypothetical protein
MQIGDKLICIKTYNSYYSNNTYYQKNKIYSITNISYNNIEEDFNYEINETLWFNDNRSRQFDIKEYFITLKEERKIKLEKLNSL